ncbi:Tat-binding 7 [Podosphaera aphanis]|nr:Tat-binding 7 [Podosphaera aphanis]
MPTKRKIELFDPNKSDSNDTDFEPNQPATKRSRKQPRKVSGSSKRQRKRGKYQESDVSNDDDEDSLLEESFSESSESEEPELNPVTGRAMRTAAKKAITYEENSLSDIAEILDNNDPSDSEPQQKRAHRPHRPRQVIDEEEDDEVQVKPTKTRTRTRMVTLKINTPQRATRAGSAARTTRARASAEPLSAGITRKSTRANTEEGDDSVSLSTSGKNIIREGYNPELIKKKIPSRGTKGIKQSVSTIEDEIQETSPFEQEAEENTISAGTVVSDGPDAPFEDPDPVTENITENDPAADNLNTEAGDQTKARSDVEIDEEDEEESLPTKRRMRSIIKEPSTTTQVEEAQVEEAEVEETDAPEPTRSSRRLTRGSSLKQKKSIDIGSDFEPPDEDDASQNEMSLSDVSLKRKAAESESSPGPTGRSARNSKSKSSSRRRESLDSADDELDQDEIAEELHDLKQSSRKRRKLRRREDSEILYERTGRARTKVDYTIKPLDQIYAADDDAEDDAPTTTARRATGGRNGANQPWQRNLFSTFGPFGGGGGPSPVIGGPWGTGIIGGADSDSSDEDTIPRSLGHGGNTGITPTSGNVPGLLPSLGQTNNLDSVGGIPGTPANLGKVKSQKALADADPLGVDQNVDFSKVGGLDDHINQLKEMVQMPLLYPELFMKFHVTPPRGVLFHGPPGTGKTLLARALAARVGSGGQKITFYMRKGADALSKWVGEAERQLRLLFDEARKTQPSIIFFDEIDGLAPVRSSKQEQIHASIVSTLLALMDGMDGRGQVVVIGATNRPDNIDPALRRPGRFDREFYFPLPDLEARRSILSIHTKDWGLDENFKTSLAQVTKGYGGADLRALCTEAALNAIQRTYPQIYSSNDKLKVDADKIKVTAKDFMLSVRKMIPSSERSTSSGAAVLPKTVEPLLREQLKKIEEILDGIIPMKKKTTALQEALLEQYEDDDHGFGRENMQRDFESSRVFRPRLLIQGEPGMGQVYLGGAILNHFEGLHVQSFDLSTIYSDSTRSPEAALVQMFAEVKRHKPSVIYIPSVETWYHTLNDAAITTFLGLLRAVPPTDPILVLGITDTPSEKTNPEILRDIFGFSKHNSFTISRPSRPSRRAFFATIGEYVRKSPKDFPEPLNRKKRNLEVLELAPPPVVKPPTKEEIEAQKKKDRQILNQLKVAIQPIMDQIQKKYKKFRTPVIAPNVIKYIFDEKDPDFVRPDIAGFRPYEIDTDKDGIVGLREVESGNFFYNLETTTIEERLSNGFYARPKDFLADIRYLAKDAKRIGDKERTLKAQELLANVEVDIALIEQNPIFADCDNLYVRQIKRAKEKEAKIKKRAERNGLGPITESENPSNSLNQAGLTVSEQQINRTSINSIIIQNAPSAPPNINETPLLNPSAGDVTMGNMDSEPPQSMLPPLQPRLMGGTTQFNSTTVKHQVGYTTSRDVPNFQPTTNPIRNSDAWNRRNLNGIGHPISSSPPDRPTQDIEIPSTQRNNQRGSSEEWTYHQTQPMNRPPLRLSQTPSSSSQASQASAVPQLSSVPHTITLKSHPTGMANLLNDSPAEPTLGQVSSQDELLIDHLYIESMITQFVDRSINFSVEQLEQINRELMDGLWRMRGDWNRTHVMNRLVNIFNETARDIEDMQRIITAATQAVGEVS